MKAFFHASDFEYNCHEMGEFGKMIRLEYAANVANAKLKEWLDAAPTVYGRTSPCIEFFDENGPSARNTAKLVCIEEIKKECKHSPRISLGTGKANYSYIAFCEHCGYELVADWKVK